MAAESASVSDLGGNLKGEWIYCGVFPRKTVTGHHFTYLWQRHFFFIGNGHRQQHQSRLEAIADEGSKSAAIVLKLRENPNKMFSTVQFGIT